MMRLFLGRHARYDKSFNVSVDSENNFLYGIAVISTLSLK